MAQKNDLVVLSILIVLIGIFYFSTVRDGQGWDDDFSMYIHHAKNTAEGVPYGNTGYIYNPYRPSVGPRTYPPVFPILLAPVYKYRGIDLSAMKDVVIVFLLLSLVVFYLILRTRMNSAYAISLTALVGLNPYFWQSKDAVVSDIPFLAFTYTALLLIDRTQPAEGWTMKSVVRTLPIAFFCYLSYGTRSLGILVMVGLVIYDVIRFRKISRSTFLILFLFALFAVPQTLLLHSERSYFDQLAISPGTILHNVIGYGHCLYGLFYNGHIKVIGFIIFVPLCLLGFVGYFARVLSKVTVFEIFFFCYAIVIIVWPSYQGERFLIPLIPLFLFYALFPLYQWATGAGKTNCRIIAIFLISAIFASYISRYAMFDFGPIRDGVGKKESTELFAYIRENTPPDSIIIFLKPRALTLYTGRAASVYHRAKNYRDLWDYMQEIRATHIIVSNLFEGDRVYLTSFVEKYGSDLQETYRNSDFGVYRIR